VDPRLFRRGLVRELWTFSSAFIIIQVAVLVATRVDIFIIKAALPLSAIAIYSLAMRVSEQASSLCVQGARAWAPVVAELHAADEKERLRQLWFTSTKMTVAFSTPLLIGLALLARPLMVGWVGEEFEGAAVLLQLLIAAQFVAVVHQDSYNMLSMRGEQGLLARSMVAGQALNLFLSLILVWEWGLVGVAFATLLAALPFDLCVVQRRLSKREGVPLLEFYRRVMLPSVAPVLVMAAAFQAVQLAWPIQGLLGVALVELGGIVIFSLLFFRWGLDARERLHIRQGIARRWRRRAAGGNTTGSRR
jgi:O-antigen/teichoic acid export membrane protein